MKKLVLIIITFLLFNQSHAQNFYEVKWTIDNVDYTALIEFFEKENIKVRVKYKADNIYKVAKYKCVGSYTYDLGKKYFFFDGKDASLVYPSYSATGYSADNFMFTDIDASNNFQNLYVYDDQDLNDGTIDNMTLAKFKKLNPQQDFTENYLYSFFEKSEPEYKLYSALYLNPQVSNNFYKLKLRNVCDKPVKVLIFFENLNGVWETKGWWNINQNETIYMEDSRKNVYYFYAQSTDGSVTWNGSETYTTFGGKQYGLKKLTKSTNDFGTWTTDMTCTSVISSPPISLSDVKFHLIFAADTEDPGIGTSTYKDMNDITNLFRKATRELGIKFEFHQLYGDNFTKTSILSKLNSLAISSKDIVLFYYSGHGYSCGYSQFPFMNLDGDDMTLESLHTALKNKNARLTLTIGDLCNSIPRSRDGTKSEAFLPFKSAFLFDTDKLKRLFVLSKGDLISTSSAKGEYSYCMKNSDGSLSNGHFTNAFINAFTKETSMVNTNTGDWNILLNSAYYEAKDETLDEMNQNGRRGQSGFNVNNVRY